MKSKKRPISKSPLIIASVISFAFFAAFGFNFISVDNQSSVGTSYASTQEPADINSDGIVDIVDLSILLSKWNTTDNPSDINNDNIVDIVDLSIMLSKWGTVVAVSDTPGAKLPINYDISSLPGTKRYVATNGNDISGNGSIGSPYATLSKAVSASSANDSIIIRGGTYREADISISSSRVLHIAAYPGEVPIFNGAQEYNSGWITEGSYRFRSYNPMPVTDGSGISFTSGQNLTGDGVGKYPDQAWVGSSQLRQVSVKGDVVEGTFWVDNSNDRIYLSSADVAKGDIEVSDNRKFLSLFSPNSVIEGIRITRYSNTASDYGVVKIYNTADNSTLRNIEISETAFIALMYIGDSNIQENSTMENVTVAKSNWMGVSALYTDNLSLNKVKITEMNQFDEFTYSPQSGAIKTSRTRYTNVVDSDISNNHSHGIWFDQSNIDIDVAGNRVVDNLGTGLFFEISDDLLLINNYIRSSGSARAVKLAGSSGLKLINNTVIGGADVVGVYTDNRSIPGCADPSEPLCSNSYGSDRDSVRPYSDILDWMPRIDAMYNNIIVYPTSSGYCGGTTTVCITSTNSSASAPLETIIHQADASRGIPKTYIDGNVYANGTGYIFRTAIGSYSSVSAITSAMSGSPVSISGIDANSKAGNSWVNSDGSPTSSLSAAHNQAIAVPSNEDINEYMPAGTKHYGVLD